MSEGMELCSEMMAAEDGPKFTALFHDTKCTEGFFQTITLLFSD